MLVLFLLSLFSFSAFADELNQVELNLFSPSKTIYISDKNCKFLLDNNKNYSIVSKSENQNIFEISSLKIDQSSAVLIFSCQNSEYVYQLKYINTSSKPKT